MDRKNFIIIMLLVIIFIIIIIINRTHNENFVDFTSASNEAVQNIAKVYSDVSGTVVFNNAKVTNMIDGNLTGNVTGDLTGDVTSNNISVNNLSVKNHMSMSNSDKPIILSIILGNYTGPIVDPEKNKFNSSDYLCEIIRTSNTSGNNYARDNNEIGIGPNGIWWITNANDWTYFVLKFTPMDNFNVISNATVSDIYNISNTCNIANCPSYGYSMLAQRGQNSGGNNSEPIYKNDQGNGSTNQYYVLDKNRNWNMIIPPSS